MDSVVSPQNPIVIILMPTRLGEPLAALELGLIAEFGLCQGHLVGIVGVGKLVFRVQGLGFRV